MHINHKHSYLINTVAFIFTINALHQLSFIFLFLNGKDKMVICLEFLFLY